MLGFSYSSSNKSKVHLRPKKKEEMRIARLGPINQEKPAVIVSDTEAVFIDDVISDFNRIELENSAISKVEKLDLSTRPKVKISDFRIGSPCSLFEITRGCCFSYSWLHNFSRYFRASLAD